MEEYRLATFYLLSVNDKAAYTRDAMTARVAPAESVSERLFCYCFTRVVWILADGAARVSVVATFATGGALATLYVYHLHDAAPDMMWLRRRLEHLLDSPLPANAFARKAMTHVCPRSVDTGMHLILE